MNVVGERDDNSWLCYNLNNAIRTREQHDEGVVIHKTFYSYYTWPQSVYFLIHVSSVVVHSLVVCDWLKGDVSVRTSE